MSEFTTSVIGEAKSTQKEILHNTLVVVVTKAHGLRNVLKMDKQSPFITMRIQNQEESTKVVPRGGQNPGFNDDLWFNLDGVEDKTLYINAYHQKKNDAKLIASGEVDFTPALKKSIEEGYDGWFDVYWEGKEAGKLYLEITYYPKKDELPNNTVNFARKSAQSKNVTLKSDSHGVFKNSPIDINDTKIDNGLPELGESMSKLKSKKRSPHRFALKSSPLRTSPTRSSSVLDSPRSDSSPARPSTGNTLMSYLDKTMKWPLFNNLGLGYGDSDSRKHDEFEKMAEAQTKLKLKSPELMSERPKNLFSSYYETESDDNSLPDADEYYKQSVRSRQEQIFKSDNERMVSLNTSRSDESDDSEEEITLGQSIEIKPHRVQRHQTEPILPFKTSARSNAFTLDDAEMRRSYQSKKLPDIINDSDDSNDEDIPPAPPKHLMSVGPLFDGRKSSRMSNFARDEHRPIETSNGRSIIYSETSPEKITSWYERRKTNRRQQKS
ncbi:uncharacterized protein C5L36_0E02910 [Pichia kudriavzevii]|uniref:C2 domain-containing protein n=1 Tax=Pichia kudriavzevii TaxID=4909 RepID=A0A2U9RBK4_PICKU|nr:uncharacterized protein C5L36_0E02910 [Pichia kudriavzevii]AWU78229.1 hypothetical protein C5L36_0E02910 [Pichia kudriavzevii]MDC6274135.1 hypothetical protein [Lacticaseibacillus paracasei]